MGSVILFWGKELRLPIYDSPKESAEQSSSADAELSEDTSIISLYDYTDNVIELTDLNFTSSIYNSDHIWFVEFYAHW